MQYCIVSATLQEYNIETIKTVTVLLRNISYRYLCKITAMLKYPFRLARNVFEILQKCAERFLGCLCVLIHCLIPMFCEHCSLLHQGKKQPYTYITEMFLELFDKIAIPYFICNIAEMSKNVYMWK